MRRHAPRTSPSCTRVLGPMDAMIRPLRLGSARTTTQLRATELTHAERRRAVDDAFDDADRDGGVGFAATRVGVDRGAAFAAEDFGAAGFDAADFATAVLDDGGVGFAFADPAFGAGALVGVAFATVRRVSRGAAGAGRSAAGGGADASRGASALSDRVANGAGADGGSISAGGGDSRSDTDSGGGSEGTLSVAPRALSVGSPATTSVEVGVSCAVESATSTLPACATLCRAAAESRRSGGNDSGRTDSTVTTGSY